MGSKQLGFIALCAVLFLGMMSCGGGAGGGQVAGGGTGGTGIAAVVVSRGSIQATSSSPAPLSDQPAGMVMAVTTEELTTSSVTVNGVAYDVTAVSDSNNLHTGMLVTVRGTLNADRVTGAATDISYSNTLLGPITSLDTLAQSFEINGQIVVIDNRTFFGPNTATFQALLPTDWVEVSGDVTPDGVVHASYVEKVSGSPTDIKLLGIVTSVGEEELTLGGRTTYSVPLETHDLNGLLLGDYVEVTSAPTAPLTATAIHKVINIGLSGNDDGEAELEGIITHPLDQLETFVVAGQAVQLTPTTVFKSGLISDLVPGQLVEVEGSLLSGLLIANEIKLVGGGMEIKSRIERAYVTDCQGTFTLLGFSREFTVDPDITECRDRTENLTETSSVKVHARIIQDNLVATRIEWHSEDYEIEAQLESVDLVNNTFTMLGVQFPFEYLSYDGLRPVRFGDGEEASVFFSNVRPGRMLEADGRFDDGIGVSWTRVDVDD